MNRRGFFGWLGAVVAWCAGVKASEPETLKTLPEMTFTQHWEPFETISFSWVQQDGIRGEGTVDVIHDHIIKPGNTLTVLYGDEQWDATIERVWKSNANRP